MPKRASATCVSQNASTAVVAGLPLDTASMNVWHSERIIARAVSSSVGDTGRIPLSNEPCLNTRPRSALLSHVQTRAIDSKRLLGVPSPSSCAEQDHIQRITTACPSLDMLSNAYLSLKLSVRLWLNAAVTQQKAPVPRGSHSIMTRIASSIQEGQVTGV